MGGAQPDPPACETTGLKKGSRFPVIDHFFSSGFAGLAGSSFTGQAESARARYRHLDELGKRGMVEWGVVDPGSVNFRRIDAEERAVAARVHLRP